MKGSNRITILILGQDRDQDRDHGHTIRIIIRIITLITTRIITRIPVLTLITQGMGMAMAEVTMTVMVEMDIKSFLQKRPLFNVVALLRSSQYTAKNKEANCWLL